MTTGADAAELDRLAQRAQRGDRDAFRDIVLAVQDQVRIAVAARAPEPDLVEEIVQQALVSAFEHLDRYQPRGTLVAWMKAIARNHLYKELRDRRTHARAIGDGLDQMVYEHGLQRLAEEDDDEQRVHRLRACLARLQPRARSLLERHYLERVPVNRLAQQFKKTASSITATLHRVRQSLRRCMGQAAAEA